MSILQSKTNRSNSDFSFIKKAYYGEGRPFSAVNLFSPPILFIYNRLCIIIVKRFFAQTPQKLQFCSLRVASYVV